MISARDSSVILDVLVGDTRFAESSRAATRETRIEDKLSVCECLVAGIYPALDDQERVIEFMFDGQIQVVPLCRMGAFLAGTHFNACRKRGQRKSRGCRTSS